MKPHAHYWVAGQVQPAPGYGPGSTVIPMRCCCGAVAERLHALLVEHEIKALTIWEPGKPPRETVQKRLRGAM